MGYIYKITNTVNDKVYIGQTIRSIDIRWKEHLRHGFNPNNNEYNRHLYKSMRKYGKDKFSIEEIECCDNDLLDEREMFWIQLYDSSNPRYGYNLTLGGEGTMIIDYDEVYKRYDNGETLGQIAREMGLSRSNLTQILKGYENYDKAVAWDRAMKDVSKRRGTPVSQYDLFGNYVATFPSSKAAARSIPKAVHSNISKSCKNKSGLSGGFQWRFADDNPPGVYMENKSFIPQEVCQLDVSFNLICVFESMCEASRKTGVDQSSISKCCNHHKQYSTAGGYIWCYAKDYNERAV
jgi:group I intron endonuclease